MPLIKYAMRGDRKEQIYEILIEKKKPLSTYGVAKELNLARSTHLQNILMEMVGEGVLIVQTAFHRPPDVHKRLFAVRKEYQS